MLAAHGHAVESARLLCFSAAGFTSDLRASSDATLVDLERIYTGS
ncbi:hypothetical protein [Saccharopolyspora flava]|nr:hypothetical protein [Saccharopolyspora flava]